MKSVAVFCGSSSGINNNYSGSARDLSRRMYEKGLEVITGGGHVGIMGVIADEIIRLGGRITGVIPQFLVDKEVAHKGLSQMIIVGSMHERKQKIEELSDGFIALPGGFGTLDEFFEIITWAQLSIHKKPIGILNTGGFYNHLINHIFHMVDEGFIARPYLDMVIMESDPDVLLDRMMAYVPKEVDKAKIALGKSYM
ncbi:MAG: TIGR00730 family Rossman fold protein [Bacteroidales bacterium]|nr:TIGR00730 family Rossman fold protein [Bacteroidales bacterium]